MKLLIKNDYLDPENNNLEIVERKGIGHPDTLADKLAEECSRVYSEYCYKKYGCVLHHNLDKLYIGAGLFKYENGKIVRYEKIRVDLNGRISNTMNGEKIDINELLIPVIKKYLKSVMPRLNVDDDVNININSTQNTKREYWYSPRNIEDIPDSKSIVAGDTALCVSHGGRTFCEEIAFQIEQLFWNYNIEGYPSPKYDDIGQDIKVMVSRIDNDVNVTLCVPVYKDKYKTPEEFDNIIKKYEKIVYEKICSIPNPKSYIFQVGINRMPDETYDKYSLVIGSCIECGEEGIVGRGNNGQGLISSFRSHTMEAPCGKNVRYHTGRVVSFIANRVVERIYNELNIKSSLYCLTRNKNSIMEPFIFYLSVENKNIENKEILKIIDEEFNENYIEKILISKKLI